MVPANQTCTYCGSNTVDRVCVQADIRYHGDQWFSVMRCRACGMMFTAPPISEDMLSQYYPSEYAAYVDPARIIELLSEPPTVRPDDVIYARRLREELLGHGLSRLAAQWHNARAREKLGLTLLRCLETYPYALPLRSDRTRVLYVGSGSPQRFRDYLALPGLSLDTVDINAEMCAAYRQAGVNAHHGFIGSMDFESGSFDVIFLSMVLEHLLEPRQEMRRLADWLAHDGIMVCTIPDMGSIEWRTNPVFYDLPRHRSFFTHSTASMLFRDAGLRVLKRIHPPFGHGFAQSQFALRAETESDFDPACFSEPCSLSMQKRSWVLSHLGQSGCVIYYLGHIE